MSIESRTRSGLTAVLGATFQLGHQAHRSAPPPKKTWRDPADDLPFQIPIVSTSQYTITPSRSLPSNPWRTCAVKLQDLSTFSTLGFDGVSRLLISLDLVFRELQGSRALASHMHLELDIQRLLFSTKRAKRLRNSSLWGQL